jgi:hypothetical protein
VELHVHPRGRCEQCRRSPTLTPLPRITFGVIVLNGEPFTRYLLRSLLPFAHQVIVVEGAAQAARNVALPTGHSSDGTLEMLRAFKAEEDPDDKVLVVTAEDEGHPDGFWPGEKDEQSRAYAARATGDYLWQVDADEFYRAEDMERILAMLRDDPSITAMSFKQLTFWGSLDYVVDGWYLRRGATYYHRLFKWDAGYQYATHRPPTVVDDRGVDLRKRHWITGQAMAAKGIYLYHYSLLFPKQVAEKCEYYSRAEWAKREGARAWANDVFMHLRRPFRVHNVYAYPSWLERYSGGHPAEVSAMMAALQRDSGAIQLRRTDDVERLLSSRRYSTGRSLLQVLEPVDRALRWAAPVPRRVIRRVRRTLTTLVQ